MILKQLYSGKSTDSPDSIVTIEFLQPVRKIAILSTTDYIMHIHYTDGTTDSGFLIPGRMQCFFDFQSANNGGGVTSLEFRSYGKEGTVYITVNEYGTGGNNDWYK